MAEPRSSSSRSPLRVVELFAGVGGFRIGLERAGGFKVIFSDQWEPGRKRQHASEIYEARFGPKGHRCEDIATIPTSEIPDHDLLVGGFPCQDYSVASTLHRSKGLVGKKGVLWWQIHRILKEKAVKPKYLLLENVDRLLKSPANQRGRDFAVMLASLHQLGYSVEWRVINAAEHGMPQRRRRVFIFGWLEKHPLSAKQLSELVLSAGLFEKAFPGLTEAGAPKSFKIAGDLANVSSEFNKEGGKSPFANAGAMSGGRVFTVKLRAAHHEGGTTLGDILLPEKQVPAAFFIAKSSLGKWNTLKGAKKEVRVAKNGHQYHYSEGSMQFPDPLDRPSRTIITGEGGAAPSRFKHVVKTRSGKLRRLTPIELERLNMFPDDHTVGAPDNWRAFFMGNALVTGVVERIGKALRSRHKARK
jgi:DNA (cytosine-5)-methyltransferase 1